ncbi:hypothetical protein [Methylophilus methylotrophus]|uniref:hypothetical protein n=1 Tax=Methylophilus methylotrophus TaxID=17 RepID=UPI000367BC8E|nr:hypothetical protein [Methylophilus methylotrophus]
METEPKGLIEEIIDNAVTPAKNLNVGHDEKTESRARAIRKNVAQTTPNTGVKKVRSGRQ